MGTSPNSPPPTNMEHLPTQQLCILTVGDGDFSCSLALMRAYSSLIRQLVATSLLSSQDAVMEAYPRALEIINELNALGNVDVLYGVDATKLHQNGALREDYRFDLVMFHHPHLGYDGAFGESSADLAKRHECLLLYYMDSANELLGLNGNDATQTYKANNILPCIHICLCANSIEKWNVLDSAKQIGLQIAWDSPMAASSPPFLFYEKLLNSLKDAQTVTEFESNHSASVTEVKKRIRQCKRAKRRGHWLGRYGYIHQATHPNRTEFGNPAVSNSFHLFFTPRK